MKIQILLVKIFVIGALFIISSQNLHLGVLNEREIFFNSYSGWVTGVVDRILDVSGYVIKFEWLPK